MAVSMLARIVAMISERVGRAVEQKTDDDHERTTSEKNYRISAGAATERATAESANCLASPLDEFARMGNV
ncbi:hypothetical protein [Caballeronia hypogeia]|uniref:hypothetical protein n=1 Tax=Caballeronia hypogeia TaxID=1777140 RepID=UPI0018DF38FC|nr:hypothetical protein [Caballeronia hypogeia]